MTPHGIVTRATLDDAEELNTLARWEDRREVEDISGKSALHGFSMGVLLGDPAYTLRTLKGELVGIVGVVPIGLHQGAIALSGTRLIEQNKISFLRGSKDVLRDLEKRYDCLLNVCDARNTVHHRWLKWLGFHFIQKVENYGANKIPVIEFARITDRKCVHF